MARTLASITALAACVAVWAQPPGAPPRAAQVDRADPAAVVKAYVEACDKGDVEAALQLVAGGDAAVALVRKMTQELRRDRGPETPEFFFGLVAEMSLLPIGRGGPVPARGNPKVAVEGQATVVIVPDAAPRECAFVLAKADDGTWCVDLEKSMVRTTGAATSFVFTEMRKQVDRESQAAAYGGDAAEHLRRLLRVLVRYIEEHGNRVPDGATWTDQLAKYCLDASLLRRPDVGKGQYGYALNAAIAGQALPQDPKARRDLVLVYQTDDLSRNATGDPAADDAKRSADAPARWLGMASGDVRTYPRSAQEKAREQAYRDFDTCQQRMSQIGEALLTYAREHAGLLPPATSWCDDIGPYLKPGTNTPDLWLCPDTPGLQYGYAISADIAGTDVRLLEVHERYVLLLHAKAGVRNEALRVPDKAETCPHVLPWNDGSKCDQVTMLSGDVQTVEEGQPYPRPPVPGTK